MLDPRYFRRDPEGVAAALKKRGLELDLPMYMSLERARKDLQTETESLQHERNEISRAIGKARSDGEDVSDLIEGVSHLGFRLNALRNEFRKVQDELEEFMLTIPNIPHESVPPGTDESENEVLSEVGDRPSFNFDVKDHIALTDGRIDTELASKITGSRFAVLRGPIARLHRALTQFMLDVHIQQHGYEELYVPYIVHRDSMQGTGQLPKFETDLFKLEGEQPYYLIPTAEVPITNVLRGQIVSKTDLPLKFVSHTPCFRSEAGSYGKDTHGIFRQHQFEKVELVQIVEPSTSWDALEELISHAETILKRLDLPYRVVSLCGGDLGFAASKTIDLEVWLPSQDRYREISSCSNFLDFQARRAQIRYRAEEGKPPELVHTLNGSGLAVGRTLIALLENFQDKDGRINIPSALRQYLDGIDHIDLTDN